VKKKTMTMTISFLCHSDQSRSDKKQSAFC